MVSKLDIPLVHGCLLPCNVPCLRHHKRTLTGVSCVVVSKHDLLTCPILRFAGAVLIIEVPDETNITGAPADGKTSTCYWLLYVL